MRPSARDAVPHIIRGRDRHKCALSGSAETSASSKISTNRTQHCVSARLGTCFLWAGGLAAALPRLPLSPPPLLEGAPSAERVSAASLSMDVAWLPSASSDPSSLSLTVITSSSAALLAGPCDGFAGDVRGASSSSASLSLSEPAHRVSYVWRSGPRMSPGVRTLCNAQTASHMSLRDLEVRHLARSQPCFDAKALSRAAIAGKCGRNCKCRQQSAFQREQHARVWQTLGKPGER